MFPLVLHQLLYSMLQTSFYRIWSSESSQGGVFLLTRSVLLGEKTSCVLGSSVSIDVAMPLTPPFFLLSTVPQARRCAPASHAWWDRPPALLPLATGDICGGRSHCGLNHLCQESGSQGGSHEEAQVLLKGSRSVEGKAQKLPSKGTSSCRGCFPTQEKKRGSASLRVLALPSVNRNRQSGVEGSEPPRIFLV